MVARNGSWSSTVFASSSAAARGSSLLLFTIFAFVDFVEELEWIWIVLPADTFLPFAVRAYGADLVDLVAGTTELLVVLWDLLIGLTLRDESFA